MKLQRFLTEFGPEIEENSIAYDIKNEFASKSFQILKDKNIYKALIPANLGGGGATYDELCYFLKDLAKYCPSTSLTLSMHMHLVAVLVFKHLNGDTNAANTLKSVAEKDLILLSTGGGDWVSSNGAATKVENGYMINCIKSFCSGSPIADIAVMSCAYNNGTNEQVLHFSVPLSTDGIEIKNDWNAMGMKATGSNTIVFKNVFVKEEKIALIRECGKWHPIWDVVSTLAFPVFIAPYAGITEAIVEKTISNFSKSKKSASHAISCLGDMHNNYQISKLALKMLVDNANNLDIKPDNHSASVALQAKSLITKHGRASAQSAMEALGGYAYHHKAGIERLYRDLLAGEFHPMQASKQKEMLGNLLIGKTLAG